MIQITTFKNDKKDINKMHTWSTALRGYFKPSVFIFLFLGFSCGLPFNLIGYSLALWMADMGISLAVIGFFALVLLPYNFKFLWAPLVDRIRLPYLASKIGAKKAWALVFQLGLILSIWGLSCFPPNKNIWTFALEITDKSGLPISVQIPLQTYLFAFLIAFFAASQDIVVDALRIDTLKKEEFGEGAGMYQFGYRMGMLLSGAGVVAASAYISWQMAYFIVGSIVVMGMVSTLFVQEHNQAFTDTHESVWKTMIINPFRDFMERTNWYWLLIFIVLYKLCNAVLGRMALPFYQQMGFSKGEISLVSGTFGPWITMSGIALGGLLVMRYNILKLLFALGVIEILTSIAFAVFSLFYHSLPAFFVVIIFDNIVGGMGGAVFVAFLSGLCNKAYSATQYALLSSLMMIAASVVSVYSGIWAQEMGWFVFFLFTGFLMLPALVLLSWLIRKNTSLQKNS